MGNTSTSTPPPYYWFPPLYIIISPYFLYLLCGYPDWNNSNPCPIFSSAPNFYNASHLAPHPIRSSFLSLYISPFLPCGVFWPLNPTQPNPSKKLLFTSCNIGVLTCTMQQVRGLRKIVVNPMLTSCSFWLKSPSMWGKYLLWQWDWSTLPH